MVTTSDLLPLSVQIHQHYKNWSVDAYKVI